MSDEELSREIVDIRHRLKRLEELYKILFERACNADDDIAEIKENIHDLQIRAVNLEMK